MIKDDWRKCDFCLRSWKLESLQFDLCPDCFEELKERGQAGYIGTKISMMIKYGDIKDPIVKEILRLVWQEVSGRIYEVD